MPIPSKAGAQDATRSHTVASIAGSVAVIVAVAVVAVVSVLVLVAVIVCGSGRSGLSSGSRRSGLVALVSSLRLSLWSPPLLLFIQSSEQLPSEPFSCYF